MAEIAGFPYGEVQGNWGISVPVGGDLKASAEEEIRVRLTPVGAPRDCLPVAIVYLGENWWVNQRAFQLEVPKRRQWLTTTVDQRLDQL